MSWTTSAPYSRQTVIFKKPVAEIAPATTPPPVTTPSAETTVTPISTVHAKPKRPLPPEKLAKLANALGVATPSPVSAQHPLFSPSSPGGSSVATSSAPSRYFLHVIPPLHLLLVDQDSANDPYVQSQFQRGTLVSLHPTLQSQLGAIAREYSLPSTGGMILYLITANNDPGPRLTEDAWRMLWYRALQTDKDGSGGNHIARFHSRSVASSIHSPYPSPSTASGSPYLQSSSSLVDDTPATSDFSSIDFSLDINPSSALPILAKIEFDIDRRKAPWYDMWKNRRRTTSLSTASSLQLSNGHKGSGTRALQLPERARSTSPSLAEFKAKYTGPLKLKKGHGYGQLDSSEGSEDDARNRGYVQLDGRRPPKKRGMVHMGEFTDDPLEDVFPSDQATWAHIRVQRDRDGEGSPTTPQTPDIMIGGKIGSAILNLDDAHEDDEESLDGDAEDVIAMWKEKHRATLESSDSRSPSLNVSVPPGVRSRSASRHVPPPLDLSKSPKSQIPHVEVAPPTATSARLSINSDLPYLDSEAAKKAKAAGQAIQIVVDPTVGDDGASNEGMGRPSVSSEEARSYTLDELEKRIGNLSPNLELSNSTPVVTVEGTPALTGTSSSIQDETDEAAASQPSLSLPSTKASRRQVSMGSFNAIPGADSLAEALANRPSSPEDKNEEQDSQEVRLQPPIDLSSAAPSPTSPGFPLSPDPFGNKIIIGGTGPSKIPGAEGDSSVTSTPLRVSSRFSADSLKSDDAQIVNVRTPSIMSVKGIRSLWRKSGNTKSGGPPLMSPGINGQYSPTTPSATEPVPPLPSSTSTTFSPTAMGPPPVPPKTPTNNATLSGGSNTSPTNASSPVTTNSASSHARSDSGTDPFHFDQESRYPVTRMPSPSQAFVDHVPPSVIVLDGPPPPTPTVPSATPTQKKGILKGWGTKGSQTKRTSAEMNRSASPSNPPSAFGSLGSGKKSRRPSINNIVTGSAHTKTSSKASISSMSSTSKHNHVNSSLSGTSHASSHQGIPAMPSPPDSSSPQIPNTTRATSPTPPTPTRKSTESSVGGLTPVTNEARKSTPPPPGAVAIAAAVAAGRERRGTSYIGPAENRI